MLGYFYRKDYYYMVIALNKYHKINIINVCTKSWAFFPLGDHDVRIDEYLILSRNQSSHHEVKHDSLLIVCNVF